jgi:hypothetical protein
MTGGMVGGGGSSGFGTGNSGSSMFGSGVSAGMGMVIASPSLNALMNGFFNRQKLRQRTVFNDSEDFAEGV